MAYIVVVDAYSSGALLAPAFRAKGYDCLHVQSPTNLWQKIWHLFRQDDFEKNIPYTTLKATRKTLESYDVKAIVAGTETGVEITDALSEALSIPGNGTQKSQARRHKFQMMETIRAAGLRAADQLASDEPTMLLEWYHSREFNRVVVKPVESAGTDNVTLCKDAAQVEKAVQGILGTENKLGLKNTHALVQEYLDGPEYFINTVSCQGTHRFTEIWRYRKRHRYGHDFVYDCNELLPYEGETQDAIRDYVLGVLDALDIRQGPAHTEIRMTQDGPALIEIGARMDGLHFPELNRKCTGLSQLDLTVESYVEPTRFLERAKQPYPLENECLNVYLTSDEEGELVEIPKENQLRSLPNFYHLWLRVKKNAPIFKTIDYFTSPGYVTLIGEDKEKLEADYRSIRELEKNGLFEIQPR